MQYRRVALLLVLYVGADFANPLMPGAVTFDADGSVEAYRLERADAEAPILPPSPGPRAQVVRPLTAPPPRIRAIIAPDLPRPLRPLPIARSAPQAPVPSPEDH